MRRMNKQEWIVVGIALAILFVVAFAVAQRKAHSFHMVMQNACLNNMMAIESAKDSYSTSKNLTNGTILSDSQIQDIAIPLKECQAGGKYTIGAIGEPVQCSFHGKASERK